MTSKELPNPELNQIAKQVFPDAQVKIDNKECPMCGTTINGVADFKDELSIKEYKISGLCSACQNTVFE